MAESTIIRWALPFGVQKQIELSLERVEGFVKGLPLYKSVGILILNHGSLGRCGKDNSALLLGHRHATDVTLVRPHPPSLQAPWSAFHAEQDRTLARKVPFAA
jgi:hypothetical protein